MREYSPIHSNAPASTPLLSTRNLVRRFRDADRPAVDNVSFELYRGEILALLGPSGCGKTTTLRMIAGFETPDSGHVLLGERDITRLPAQKRRIGMVFQDYALFPHMTLAENVAFAMTHLPRKQRHAKALEWLALVNMEELGERFPEELSGGQQQRVALVRTLAAEPELVLLDEPFSNLDAGLRERTRKEMRELFKKTDTTVILVTHDQAEAMTMADRIGVMRQGRLLQVGQPQAVYREPADAFVAEFLGHTNLLEGEAAGLSATTALGPISLNTQAHGPVTLSLRPEDLALVRSEDPDSAIIVDREFRGHDFFYLLARGDSRYCAIVPNHDPLEVGARVKLHTAREASVLPGEGHPQRQH